MSQITQLQSLLGLDSVPFDTRALIESIAAVVALLYALALLSTLAGNLLLSGSLTNVLIAERADRLGAPLGFRDHAKAGVPLAVISLAFAILWLAVTHTPPLFPTPLLVNQ